MGFHKTEKPINFFKQLQLGESLYIQQKQHTQQQQSVQ